jgi:hypothetical protein
MKLQSRWALALIGLMCAIAGCGGGSHPVASTAASSPVFGPTSTPMTASPGVTRSVTTAAAPARTAPRSAPTPTPTPATQPPAPTPARPHPRATPATVHTCYPSVHIAALHIEGTTIPATTIPGTTVGGAKLPAVHLPATTLPPVDLPATTLPGGCFDVSSSFALPNTTVRVSGYSAVDPGFSPTLSERYWSAAGSGVSVPDPTAPGFGKDNAAGFPRNQYVRPYVRRDGTLVSGYWRNDPTDGLPTCRVVSC